MSKYGFNENEVRRTIVDMIDKDGFHKETVYDGKYESGTVAPFGVGIHSDHGVRQDDDVVFNHMIVAINAPDDCYIFATINETDTEYELNIGDAIPDNSAFNYLDDDLFEFPSIKARCGFHEYILDRWVDHFYYNIYLVDRESYRVIDRTKSEAIIHES